MKQRTKHHTSRLVLLGIGFIAVLGLTACSKDDVTGEPLPEGKYPLTFTAAGLEILAATRAKADDTWTENDEVAVKVDGLTEVKKYTASNGSSASTTLNAANGVTPFYWQNTGDINVSAWYLGTGYDATLPTAWSVKTDQNSNNGYQQSDFLYAPLAAIDFKGTKPLTFYHQTAKVVVNIRTYGVASDAGKINSVSIKAVSQGTFNVNASGNYRLSASGSSYVAITSQKTTANTAVVFEANKTGETALASYQALVIPQALSSSTPIEIKIDGYDTFKYTPNGGWVGGTQYTYNLTIKGSEVTATVASGSMTWTEGGSGAGTAEI